MFVEKKNVSFHVSVYVVQFSRRPSSIKQEDFNKLLIVVRNDNAAKPRKPLTEEVKLNLRRQPSCILDIPNDTGAIVSIIQVELEDTVRPFL
jgi:hypothetical protein